VSIGEIAAGPRWSGRDDQGLLGGRIGTGVGPIAIWYLGIAAVLLVVNWATATFWASTSVWGAPRNTAFVGDRYLGGWVHWDSSWYRSIATDGYSYVPGRPTSVAFFPGYPLAMRGLGHVVGDPVTAGVMISVASGLLAAVLLFRFTRDHCGTPTARIAVAALLLYPYAWYLFGAVYSDAMFLAAALGAFVLAEADRPLLAGLAGALATASRPVGIAVVVGLVALELTRTRGRRPRRLDLALLSVGGLVAWCIYLWRTYGDALLFLHVESVPGWDEAPGPRTLLKLSWFEHLSHVPDYLAHHTDPQAWFKLMYAVGTSFQAILALGALALVPRIDRRLGRPYALYTAVAVGVAVIGSKDWQGLGRYLLAAFPVFVALADLLLERMGPVGRRTLGVASGALLVFLTTAFARGHYLA